MRFWKLEAETTRLHDSPFHRETTRHVNIYGIDEVSDEYDLRDAKYVKTGRVALYLHSDSLAMAAQPGIYYVKGTATEIVAELERRIAADRLGDPPTPPARIGHAHAAANTQVTSVTVATLDGYDGIEFVGKAGATAGAVLAVAEPFRIAVDRADIPINTNPVLQPRSTLTIPKVGNIVVSRSADGRTLYFVGDDAAAVFSIELFGHKAD